MDELLKNQIKNSNETNTTQNTLTNDKKIGNLNENITNINLNDEASGLHNLFNEEMPMYERRDRVEDNDNFVVNENSSKYPTINHLIKIIKRSMFSHYIPKVRSMEGGVIPLDLSNIKSLATNIGFEKRGLFLDNILKGHNNLVLKDDMDAEVVNKMLRYTDFSDTNNAIYSILLANTKNRELFKCLYKLINSDYDYICANIPIIYNLFLYGTASTEAMSKYSYNKDLASLPWLYHIKTFLSQACLSSDICTMLDSSEISYSRIDSMKQYVEDLYNLKTTDNENSNEETKPELNSSFESNDSYKEPTLETHCEMYENSKMASEEKRIRQQMLEEKIVKTRLRLIKIGVPVISCVLMQLGVPLPVTTIVKLILTQGKFPKLEDNKE